MASFQSVSYVDPFAPLPTGASQAGVTAALTGADANTVAYAQLLGNQTPLGYGGSSTNNTVRVLNTVPLVSAWIDVLLSLLRRTTLLPVADTNGDPFTRNETPSAPPPATVASNSPV